MSYKKIIVLAFFFFSKETALADTMVPIGYHGTMVCIKLVTLGT